MALSASVLRMRDLLLRAGVVDDVQMRAALGRLERFGGRLPKVLADMGLVDEDAVTRILGEALRVQVVDLRTLRRDPNALSRLDVRLCEANAIFPMSLNQRTHTLLLAMADPMALDVVDLVAARVNARVQTALASESQIAAAIAHHYYGRPMPAEPEPNLARRAVTARLEEPAPRHASTVDDAAPSPGAQREAKGPLSHPPSAKALLDEMLGEEPERAAFSEEELARLESLRRTQEKTATILRALRELLASKGYRT